MGRPIEVKVTGNVSSATAGLRDVNTELGTLQDAGRGKFSGLKQLGTALLAGGALYKAGNYLKDAAFAASDMNETVSKTKQVFGKDAAGILKWSKTTNAALVATEQSVLDTVAGFDLLIGNKGITGPQGLKMSKTLTNLSADLASFFNTDVEQAAGAISSALKGEMDPIEAYGVSINDAALKLKAFEMGLYSGKGALDATSKAQAAYALIMDQTAKAQGDVTRTQGGFANQWRILNTELSELKTNVGKSLTPIGEAILPEINAILGDINSEAGLKGMGGFFAGIATTIRKDLAPGIRDFATRVKNVDTKDLKTEFGWLKDAVDNIAAGGKKVISAFNGLSPEAKSNIATLVAAGAALKVLTATNPVIKIGVNLAGEVVTSAASATASAVVGRLFNRAIPMNVYVVNQVADIDTPAGKGKVGNIVKNLTFIGDVIALASLTALAFERSKGPADRVRKDLDAARRDIKAMDTDLVAVNGKAVATAQSLRYEKQLRARAFAAVWESIGKIDARRKVSMINYPGSGYSRSATSSSYAASEAAPLVTDEMIARAVYGVLMRSGIRNGTTPAAVGVL